MCIWPLPSIRREGVDARERAEGRATFPACGAAEPVHVGRV